MNTRSVIALTTILFLSLKVFATNYEVGPGQPRTTLSAVPWANLQPGDFVNIHYKAGGYHEKIQISASGTAAQHIVIRGIPDPTTAALPILDAQNAVDDPSMDLRNGISTTWGLIIVSPRKATYVYGAYHVSWVDIESLDLRNAYYTADNSISFKDQFGAVHGYDGFACGIYIEWAHDFAVRGCEISNCCNGLFANSKNLVTQSSQRLLVEKNYFHDNSLPYTVDPNNPNVIISNGYHEHHVYTESAGCIIQYNRFGKLRANAHGVAIKDRSSGQIIRYNEFDMTDESNVLALPNCQGGSGFINLQPDYQDAYVYGNIITIENYASSITAVMWGAFDGANLYAPVHRGTLHFYNNTIVNHHNGVCLFLMPDATYTSNANVTNPTYENVDFRNNIVFSDTSVQSSIYSAQCFVTGGTTNGGGDITLGNNWISPNWRKDSPNHLWSGALNGTANLLVGDVTAANNAHFVDISGHDYHVLTGSNIIDTAGAQPPSALPANDVTQEYLAPQSYQARVQQSIGMDLGALESTGQATPPPVQGALQFNTSAYSKAESAGSATITVTRVGGSTGAVGVSYSTPAGGTASAGSDYTSVVGTLAWLDGDSASKTFSVPIINDSLIEANETISLALFAPSGGAVLGTQSTATLTLLDDDLPPSTLMYGLTNTSNVLLLFKSDAPGTPLVYYNLTGLTNGDSLRALAVQPTTGKLFTIGTAGILYTLNPFTGGASAVGAPITTTLTGDTMDLSFDHVTGLLRLTTASGQNLTLSPLTGALVSMDTPLAYASTDVNSATVPLIVGLDDVVSNGVHTVYGIDAVKDALVTLGSPSGQPLSPATGQLMTVGVLGFNTTSQAALHIPAGASFGWACLSLPGATGSGLYAVNLSTGGALFMGAIRTAEQVRDIVVAPPRDVWKQARFGTNAGSPAIAGDTADPDHNGISNLIEYALGAPAVNATSVPLPIPSYTGDYLSLTFTRPTTATDVTYTVQVSDDLVTWHNGSTYAPTGDTPSNAYTTETLHSTSGSMTTITVRDNAPTSSTTKHFIRLVVTAP